MKLLHIALVTCLSLFIFSATSQVVPQSQLEVKTSFSPVVKKAAPAVVNIYTKGVVTTRSRSVMGDPFFDNFFGRRGYGSMPRERVTRSLGSGVIVSGDGVIVTNNHVIEGMNEIKVVMTDRREYEATVLLADPQTDLAILKVEADEVLPSLSFADSDDAEVGDLILAIGNPFGVGQTVTSGIVSALARTQVNVSDFQFFIQTDAAINPGNSGGALVDVNGNLLGVNTAIYSRSGGSNGIGFAIPGNLVKQVVASATNGGEAVRRPWLGASTETIDSNFAKALNLAKPAGAIVNELFPSGPAAKAGIKEGDVILKINDYDIFDSESLRYRVGTSAEKEVVDIVALRDGKERNYRVRLGLPPESPKRQETIIEGANPFSGIKVANLSPALNVELGRGFMDKGVVILDTVNAPYARRFGMAAKLKILSVNGVEIETVKDLKSASTMPGDVWTIRVQSPSGRVSTTRFRGRF